MVHSAQTAHQSCDKISTISKRTETSFTWAFSPRSTIGCVQNNFDPMLCLAKTVHLSCSHTNTIAKRTKTRLHMCHITDEFHQLHPKWFPSRWYVRHKLCTYLALTLTPSLNRLKRHLTWPTSPRSSIWCVQNYFQAYGMFGVNNAPLFCQD
jgi:hypothetical protein